MRDSDMRILRLITLPCALSLAACGSIQVQNTDGTCSQTAVASAGLLAYSGTLAAIDAGAPLEVLARIQSGVADSVKAGKVEIDILDIIIKDAGGAPWARYLAGVSVLFGEQIKAAVDKGVNAQVCAVPILGSIAKGMEQAMAISAMKLAA